MATASRITEQEARDAMRVVQAHYWQDVHDLAEDVRDRIRSGELEDEEAVDEAIFDGCDSASRIIQTWWARVTLCCVTNPTEYEEQMGEKPGTVEGAAFMAYRSDVHMQLAALLDQDPEDATDDEEEETKEVASAELPDNPFELPEEA